MQTRIEKLKPYLDKVTQDYRNVFHIAPIELEKGVIFLKRCGFDNFIEISDFLSDMVLMKILVGAGTLEIAVLLTDTEEMAKYIDMYMPFLEAIRTDDPEDNDEPIQYYVSVNEEALDPPTEGYVCVDGIYVYQPKQEEE